jgi:23S rRNA (guanine745-N1)-methyltransferase
VSVVPLPLSCTVRGCGRPLTRGPRAWTCDSGHTFDVARAGYVNLLQPQDRKSLDAGDSREAVAARAALLAAGVGQGVVQTVAHALGALALADEAVVVDVGAGTGDVLGVAAARWVSTAIGIDLSTAAAEHAARRFPASTWVVANADRRLPLLDHSVDVLLSIHARRLPDEAARVLKPSGVLIVAVPGADDLIELRAMVQGEGVALDRTESLVAEHAARFVLRERASVRDRRRLDRALLLALLRSTYRGGRSSAAARVEALDHLDVTLASDLCLFAPVSANAGA